jgi:hypothetical protein
MNSTRYSPIAEGSDSTYDRHFHEMWTSAVGKVGYVKEPWRSLDGQLERARTKGELDAVMQDASALMVQQDPHATGLTVALASLNKEIHETKRKLDELEAARDACRRKIRERTP